VGRNRERAVIDIDLGLAMYFRRNSLSLNEVVAHRNVNQSETETTGLEKGRKEAEGSSYLENP
jgi:hypothetical protein